MTDLQALAKREWIERVLGVPLGATADGTHAGGGPGADEAEDADFATRWKAAMAAWQSGIETVDGQIEQLGRHLGGSDDERLRGIADKGLNAITGNHKVKVMAALLGVTQASPTDLPARAAKAEGLVLEFQDHLLRDARVAACDSNPFGINVAVCATLVPLLGRLETLLASVAG